MNENQIRELLREMREEPVPPDSAARVRQAVAARIVARPRGWWKLGLAAAAAAAVIALVMWQTAKQAEPMVVALPEVAPPAPEPLPKPAPPPAPPRRPRRAAKPAPAPGLITIADPAVTIRLQTEDPEVVILLVN